ncbi:5'-methylthioribose kinase [Psychrobacillus sp. OK028]|uniref:S-methyl-5-thioribose kinase n=1 Tax=Psychrobacillus sp. OK028 TaxID=1884359 RepID=UPI00088894F3|nr:S-methyl-5-thioribose kinase [Psychrobacillus sp. OK028]SDN88094.1 5'-methylthioribose kinase [Psychrobacillus sp. OK028]
MAVVTTKQYESLTEETAISLAKELSLFSNEAQLVCKEIGDGNLNYVFHITDQVSKQGIIIKQALPYAKVIGESWPLTLKRAKIEATTLQKHGEYAVGLVPKVYATDEDLAITVMEDLSHLQIVREGLIKGESYPKLSTDIGEYLALTLFNTSDFALHPFEKKALVVEFSNPELCKITEDLIFTDPFFNHETNDFEPALQAEVEAIWTNHLLKLEVAKLKRSFLTEAEALLHGDLHTGSIFASEQETKVIDPEFAFYGPIGFDIGLFLANLIVQSITREGEQREFINEHIQNTWLIFSAKFSDFLKQSEFDSFKNIEGYDAFVLEKIFHDSLGFAGCELIRRTIGLAHVKDLDSIENQEQRILLKKQTLKAGELLIVRRYQIDSIDAVIELLGEIQQ